MDQQSSARILASNRLHVLFSSWFWHTRHMHVCILVSLLLVAWFFLCFKNHLNLPFPFMSSHVVMRLFLHWAMDCWKVLDLGAMVLGKSQVLGVEMVFSVKPLISGWREENSSRYGEGTLRHPSLVWFCDLKTCLGEITID